MSRIFYHCYDSQHPTGGQKDTYQHVDVLNASGFDAYAVHTLPGFRLSWFSNNTKTIDEAKFKAIYRPDIDFVVLPETLGSDIAAYEGRKVIFNKNIYHGFQAQARGQCCHLYSSPEVVAMFAVSEHNRRHLQFAYPGKEILVVPYDIRADRFCYTPLRQKKAQIAFLPKQPTELVALTEILRSRAAAGVVALNNLKSVILRDLTEDQVVKVLSESLLLVFLSTTEGLPRVPLEAMASGTLVVAYGDPPLNEYLPPEYQFQHGELFRAAEFIEDVIVSYPSNLQRFDDVTKRARSIAEQYSFERQRRVVCTYWERLLNGQSCRG